MLAKLDTLPSELDSASFGHLVDLLFEIGKYLYDQSSWTDALWWFEQTQSRISNIPRDEREEELSACAEGYRAKCLIHIGGAQCIEQAWRIVEGASTTSRETLTTLLLKLELLAEDNVVSPERYELYLSKLMCIVHLTQSNLDIISHHIRVLAGLERTRAHAVLEQLLKRVLSEGYKAYIAKIVVTMVWNSALTASEPQGLTGKLHEIFDHLTTIHNIVLEPTASRAAQTFLWKRIDAEYGRRAFAALESWCYLCKHDLWDKSTQAEHDKTDRRLMLCAFEMSDFVKARDIARCMSDASRKHAVTQYVLYRIGVRIQDPQLSSSALEAICSNPNVENDFLLACVLEAQRNGDDGQVLATLRNVLRNFEADRSKGIHIPALLRCNIRLLIPKTSNGAPGSDLCRQELCKLFEMAATHAESTSELSSVDAFSLQEKSWFSCNLYNLVLRQLESWDVSLILRLLHANLHFMGSSSSDLPGEERQVDLSLRRLFCAFLCASLHLVLARSGDVSESQAQNYVEVQKAVELWQHESPRHFKQLEGHAQDDLRKKHNTLLMYNFEASANLKSWSKLESNITDLIQYYREESWSVLADIILSCGAPSNVVLKCLQHIINGAWTANKDDCARLAKWIRCLVSLAMYALVDSTFSLIVDVLRVVKSLSKVR